MLAVHMDIKKDIKVQRMHGEMLWSNVIQEIRLDNQVGLFWPLNPDK